MRLATIAAMTVLVVLPAGAVHSATKQHRCPQHATMMDAARRPTPLPQWDLISSRPWNPNPRWKRRRAGRGHSMPTAIVQAAWSYLGRQARVAGPALVMQ